MTIIIDFSKGFNKKETDKIIKNLPCSDEDKRKMKKQAEKLYDGKEVNPCRNQSC